MLEAEQRVGDVEEVPELHVLRRHPGRSVAYVHRHAVVAKRDRPEQAAWVGVDPRVEVMHLGGEVYEVVPTSVEVKSNESECAEVNGAILADIVALHEAHIGVEEERLDAAVGMFGGSLPAHVCDADRALEIGDR